MLTEEQLHERFPWTAELAFNTSMTKKDVDEKTVPDGVVLLGYKTENGKEKVHRFNTGNNAGEIMPKLLMAKFQMIESGVVSGNEMSRLLWSPNLRLSTASRPPHAGAPSFRLCRKTPRGGSSKECMNEQTNT